MKLSEVGTLAKELIQTYCPDYTFKFDSSRSRFGQCRYNQKEIGISRYLASVNSYSQVKDTILHEIAHALTRSGHDEKWRQKCIELGARPVRCYDVKEVQSTPKYRMSCPACSRTYQANKKPKSNGHWICRFDRTPTSSIQ